MLHRYGWGKAAQARKFWICLLLAAGLIAQTFPAAAADACKSQSHVDVPVTLADGVPIMRLTVSSKELVLILDTGAESTVISTSAADRLQLARTMVYPRRLRGLGGGVVAGTIALPGLAIAGVELPNFGALVGPIDLPKLGGVVPDGVLGADILSDYDVDLDLAHSRVRLVCSLGPPDWTRPYRPVEANRSVHNRLFFWSTLDGKKVAVIVDTGAQHSVVDSRAALAAGMDAQAFGREPAMTVRGISGAGGMQARRYRFREMLVGGVNLANPPLVVAPLGLEDADVVLGADFLRDHRVRLSYRLRRIFLSRF